MRLREAKRLKLDDKVEFLTTSGQTTIGVITSLPIAPCKTWGVYSEEFDYVVWRRYDEMKLVRKKARNQ
jgi:hypothetical protein